MTSDVESGDLNATVKKLIKKMDTEAATTRRFRMNLAALVLLSVVNLIGLGFAYQAANDAGTSADTLKDCLLPTGKCAARLANEGKSSLARQMDFQICWAQVPVENRTKPMLEKCRDDILDDISKGAK